MKMQFLEENKNIQEEEEKGFCLHTEA